MKRLNGENIFSSRKTLDDVISCVIKKKKERKQFFFVFPPPRLHNGNGGGARLGVGFLFSSYCTTSSAESPL